MLSSTRIIQQDRQYLETEAWSNDFLGVAGLLWTPVPAIKALILQWVSMNGSLLQKSESPSFFFPLIRGGSRAGKEPEKSWKSSVFPRNALNLWTHCTPQSQHTPRNIFREGGQAGTHHSDDVMLQMFYFYCGWVRSTPLSSTQLVLCYDWTV